MCGLARFIRERDVVGYDLHCRTLDFVCRGFFQPLEEEALVHHDFIVASYEGAYDVVEGYAAFSFGSISRGKSIAGRMSADQPAAFNAIMLIRGELERDVAREVVARNRREYTRAWPIGSQPEFRLCSGGS
jgi:hypothetical protein